MFSYSPPPSPDCVVYEILLLLFITAVGLSPGGSGYLTSIQNMTLFYVGTATSEACSGNLECWEPSQHSLKDTGKPSKTCVEVAGRRAFRIPTSSQQFGIKSKNINTHSTTSTQGSVEEYGRARRVTALLMLDN